MQKLKLNKQVIVFSALSIFLIAELFILLPWEVKETFSLSKKTALLKRNTMIAQRDWASKDTFLKNKEELKKEMERMHTKAISSYQVSKLLSFISAGSKDFEIEIQALSPSSSGGGSLINVPDFEYLPIAIKAEGKFHNLAMFLDYLQNSRYFFEIKELSIKSGYPFNSINMTICGLIKD